MNLLASLQPLPRSPIIAFTGAGGKTSLISRLGRELTASGQWVIVTTTTHIWPPDADQAEFTVVEPDAARRRERLADVLAGKEGGRVVVASRRTDEGKLAGVPADEVESFRLGTAAVLVEADGARGRGLKAPGDHEPVIPPTADCVVVVCSVGVAGRRLDPDVVHRPERIAAISGLKLGEVISPEVIGTVLSHPQGGLRSIPATARAVAFVNRVEDGGVWSIASMIASQALARPGLMAVAIGAAQAADPVLAVHERVIAVVLAAGGAHRFGQLKQVLPWQGTTLVRWVASAAKASQAWRVMVVVGSGADRVRAALAGMDVDIIDNPAWASGQSTSMQVALQSLPSGVGAALFLLADQPGVSPQLIDAVIQRERETLAPIAVPFYGGQRGNPVLFRSTLFSELLSITGDMGGRQVISRHAPEVVRLDWPGPIPEDIDTPEDYERLSKR